MNTGLGWIDFSKKHRDILKSVLDALSDKGIVDELGIGSIRNSIADSLFPGISTIQTRAKYYVLVVQLIAEYEENLHANKKFVTPKNFSNLKNFLQKRENEIIKKLAEKYRDKETGDRKETGIIGINAARRNEELQRKPSSIYWNGIRTHGLIQTTLNFSEYLAMFSKQRIGGRTDRNGTKQYSPDFDDNDAGSSDRFGLNLPRSIRRIDDELSIELSKDEAEYLRERFKDSSKTQENLLSEILKDIELAREFVGYMTYREMVKGFKGKQLPADIINVMELGEQFDFIIHGAHIYYNCLLNKELAGDKWALWLAELKERQPMVKKFNLNLLKQIASRAKATTFGFIESWIEEIKKEELNLENLDRLIKDQERWNKKNLARLSMEHKEPIEEWVGLGNDDQSSMSFRFGNVKRIVDDILIGLK